MFSTTTGGPKTTDFQLSDRDRQTVDKASAADLKIGDTVYKIADIDHWEDAIKRTHNTKHKWTSMHNHQVQRALSQFNPDDPDRHTKARSFVNASPGIELLRNLLFRMNFEPSFIRKFVESDKPLVPTPGVWFVASVLQFQYNLHELNQAFKDGHYGPLETEDPFEGLIEFVHSGALSTLHSILSYGIRCSNTGSSVKGKIKLGVYGEGPSRYMNSVSTYGTHASIPKCGNDNIVWCVVYRCLGDERNKQNVRGQYCFPDPRKVFIREVFIHGINVHHMPQCGQNKAELVLANSTIARLTGEPNAPQPKLLSKTLGVPLELRPLRDLIDDCEEPEVTRAVPLLSLIHI